MATETKPNAPDRMIGILGGMGPEATLDLYRNIIALTPATRDQDHIRVLIYSNPKIPDRTEAIAAGGVSPLPDLIESARILERGGAGILTMPCNAAHHFLPMMRKEISIPILDMVEETCRRLHRTLPETKVAGLIATSGTVHSRVYHQALSHVGIELLVPPGSDQHKVEEAIGQVKAGTQNRSTRETFQSIGMRLFERGAQVILLGCTEIPLAFEPSQVSYLTVNPTLILAEAAVNWALGARQGECNGLRACE